MKIRRDDSIERWLLDEMIASFNKEREGIHLSDLLSPRKAFWQKVMPKPPTDSEVMYWLTGRGHEDAMHRTSGYPPSETKSWEEILYSTDMFHNFPAEIKTRRGNLAKEGEEIDTYDLYIRQLRGYCAIVHSPMGWLHVWSLIERQADFTSKPELACYEVEFTEEELQETRNSLLATKAMLIHAISTKDHALLPLCDHWMCGKTRAVVTKKARCVECNKEFETLAGGEKHAKSKTGAGHTVEPAEFKYEYDVRCKWFHECKPYEYKKEGTA